MHAAQKSAFLTNEIDFLRDPVMQTLRRSAKRARP
jgi:hypothetical protein